MSIKGTVTKEFPILITKIDQSRSSYYQRKGKYFKGVICFPKINKVVGLFHEGNLVVIDVETSKYEEFSCEMSVLGRFIKWDDQRFVVCSKKGKLKVYKVHPHDTKLESVTVLSISLKDSEGGNRSYYGGYHRDVLAILKLNEDKIMIFTDVMDILVSIFYNPGLVRRNFYPGSSYSGRRSYYKDTISPCLSPSKPNSYYVKSNQIFRRNWKEKKQTLSTERLNHSLRATSGKYIVYYDEKKGKEFLVVYGSANRYRGGDFDGDVRFFDCSQYTPVLYRVIHLKHTIPFRMFILENKYIFSNISELLLVLSPKKGLQVLDIEEDLLSLSSEKKEQKHYILEEDDIEASSSEGDAILSFVGLEDQDNLFMGENKISCISVYSVNGSSVDLFIGLEPKERSSWGYYNYYRDYDGEDLLKPKILKQCRVTGLRKLENYEHYDLVERTDFLKFEEFNNNYTRLSSISRKLFSIHFPGMASLNNTCSSFDCIPKSFFLL